MPRHRKSKAKELVHIDTLTGDAVYLDPSFECMVLFGESTYIPKLARDLTAGDVILNLEYIGKIHLPIDRLRPILTAGSARYREAYRSNYRSVGNIEMTLLSHSLLGGLQNEGGLEAIVAGPATRRIAEDIAKVHMMAAVDEYNSRKEEFDVETNQFLDPSDEQVANWLSGATLAPRDWRYFEAFSAYGDGTQEKPDWRQMASWKKDPENRFYRQYTALVSYHRVFSQILNQFEDIIEVSGLEKPSQQSRESSERMETGYADDLRALLSRMGIKRRDRAVAVVSGHPTIETVNKEDSAFREIKGLPEEDAGYLAQDLGRMMNEYSLLLALCAKALEDTLTKDTRDSKDVMLAVWSYLSEALPEDGILATNARHHGIAGDAGWARIFLKNMDKDALDRNYAVLHAGSMPVDDPYGRFDPGFRERHPDYSRFRDAVARLSELRTVIPARYEEAVDLVRRIGFAEDYRAGDKELEQYKLTGQQLSLMRSELGRLTGELAVYFQGNSITIV